MVALKKYLETKHQKLNVDEKITFYAATRHVFPTLDINTLTEHLNNVTPIDTALANSVFETLTEPTHKVDLGADDLGVIGLTEPRLRIISAIDGNVELFKDIYKTVDALKRNGFIYEASNDGGKDA